MNTFEEQIKNTMAEWQKRFEEMRVQFTLGKMDAGDSFEQYKTQLKNGINHLKAQLEEAGNKAEDHTKELYSKLEQVLAQLNLGKADGLESFKEQREKIEAALHELYLTGKASYNKQYEQMLNLFENSSNSFKIGLEIMQLQFSLAKMNTKDEADAIRKSLQEKMNEMSGWFKQTQEETMKTMEEWGKLAKENLEKMQNWAQDFSKGFKK